MSTPRRTPRGRRPDPKEWLLAVRIPESLDARLDAFCESLRVEVPWVRMTRSDAVRWLLKAQLETLRETKSLTTNLDDRKCRQSADVGASG